MYTLDVALLPLDWVRLSNWRNPIKWLQPNVRFFGGPCSASAAQSSFCAHTIGIAA